MSYYEDRCKTYSNFYKMLSSISGFPELLPQDQILFNKVLDIIKKQFELYGFTPFDSPAVEKIDVLLAKGNDHEIYGIHRLADQQDKDLGLRFDLTVPFARYVAQRVGQLTFPYRRYQIGPVWRGERPQAGRYRQFYQCDIDIVGDNQLSLNYDAEILLIIYKVFKALSLENITIRLNNSGILKAILLLLGVKEENFIKIMRIIDKIDKLSENQIHLLLIEQSLTDSQIAKLLFILKTSKTSLDSLTDLLQEDSFIHKKGSIAYELLENSIADLNRVIKLGLALGVPDNIILIDIGLARGLNYYTGTIYEVQLHDHPELGSICGGGRYENLVTNFGNRKLPGVGISIGITRLMAKLLEIWTNRTNETTLASVIVTNQNPHLITYYIKIAELLRTEGIYTEVYLEDKNLSQQMKYANKRGFKIAVIADQPEFVHNSAIIRNLNSGIQEKVQIDEIYKAIGQLI